MFQKNRISFLCKITLTFLLFGCIPSNETSDFSNLVLPKDCKNACWMGIEPEVSTTDETMKILENFYGSKNVTKDNTGEGLWIISWNTNNPNWQNNGVVFISNNVVDNVVAFPNNSLAVKDIIAEIGSPDSVGLVISGPVVKCAGASLLYPQMGLMVNLSLFDKSVGVAETQVANGFDFYPPWTSGNYPKTDTAVIPWSGYHEYCPEKWFWEE